MTNEQSAQALATALTSLLAAVESGADGLQHALFRDVYATIETSVPLHVIKNSRQALQDYQKRVLDDWLARRESKA